MADYPTAYTSFSAHGATMNVAPLHDDIHVQVEEEVVAIQQELGLSPSSSYATVTARLSAMDTVDAGLDTRLDAAEVWTSNMGLSSWTPSVTQGVSVSVTVDTGHFRMVIGGAGTGGIFLAAANINCTSAGTSGSAIVLTTPYTLLNAGTIWGGGVYTRQGAPDIYIHLEPFGNDTTTFLLVENRENGALGTDPAFGIANTDIISIWLMGRRA